MDGRGWTRPYPNSSRLTGRVSLSAGISGYAQRERYIKKQVDPAGLPHGFPVLPGYHQPDR